MPLLAPALTAVAEARSKLENMPACGPIPLVWRCPSNPFRPSLDAETKVLPARVHRRPRLGAVLRLPRLRRPAAATPGAAPQWRRLVRRLGFLHPVPAGAA